MPAISPRGQFAAFSLFVLVAVPALMSATSCTDEPKTVVQTEAKAEAAADADGIELIIDGKGEKVPGLDLGKDLPSFAPVYPGATVTTQMGKPGEGGVTGRLVVMESKDPVDKVAAFYDAKAKEAGITPSMFVNETDSAVRIYGGADGDERAGGALIAISKAEDGTGSEIVITSGMAKTDVARLEGDKESWRRAVRPDIRLQ